MSEEETKAIEDLKILKLGIIFLNCIPGVEKDEIDIKAIDIILNLIEKQQKEIEELKKNYIKKDKIKAMIEDLENQKKQWIEDRDNKHKDSEIIYAIEVLQSLLEGGIKC